MAVWLADSMAASMVDSTVVWTVDSMVALIVVSLGQSWAVWLAALRVDSMAA